MYGKISWFGGDGYMINQLDRSLNYTATLAVVFLHIHPEVFLTTIVKLFLLWRNGISAIMHHFITDPALTANIIGLERIGFHFMYNLHAIIKHVKDFAFIDHVFPIRDPFDVFCFINYCHR